VHVWAISTPPQVTAVGIAITSLNLTESSGETASGQHPRSGWTPPQSSRGNGVYIEDIDSAGERLVFSISTGVGGP